MKLVIVGSVLARAIDTKPIIKDALFRLRPEIVGSGGADGTDTHVEESCDEWGFKFKKFTPETRSWNGHHGYKWRNMEMVRWGTYFIRIDSVRSTTYGSGWTADRAEDRGKPVERYTVR